MNIVQYLKCPICHSDLKKEKDIITCKSCKKKYVIDKGIIKMDLNDDFLTKKVKKTYDFGWNKWRGFRNEYTKEFFSMVKPLKKEDFKGKVIVDLGCGQGRFTKILADCSAKEIIAIDIGNSIYLAKNKLKKHKNISFIQADIYNLPLKPKIDMVVCLGVLQHLKSPSLAFKKIIELCKNGTEVVIWVYGNSRIITLLKSIRKFSKKMPLKIVYYLTYALCPFMYLFKNYRHRSYTDVRWALFDHLTVPLIDFFEKEDIENWLLNSNQKHFNINERYQNTQGKSWRIYGRTKK